MAVFALPGVVPGDIADNEAFGTEVLSALESLERVGVKATLKR